MSESGTRPRWVTRQMERRAARYADDRVIRWIVLPARWGRKGAAPRPPAEGASVVDLAARRDPDAS